MWSQKHFCWWSFTFECLHVFGLLHLNMFRLQRRKSARWCLLMFNEVTLRGFLSNHKHSTRISLPDSGQRRHFYHFIALPEQLRRRQRRRPVIYSVAHCTVITVGRCSFGSESLRSAKWVTVDGNVRITPGSAAAAEAASNEINEIVCVFRVLFPLIGWGFSDARSQSK